MTSGIRAEVRVDAPENCRVARTSAATGASISSVSRTSGADETVTEEFAMESDAPADADLEAVFDYGTERVYRFDRERGRGCACERVERHDAPVVDVHSRDGDLFLTFHVPDLARLRDIVTDLQAEYDDVDVRRLVRSTDDRRERDPVFVDRGTLTERQREVLQTANDLGYFDHPKGANAGEVAAALGVSRSTFSEHLAAAQRKLLDAILAS